MTSEDLGKDSSRRPRSHSIRSYVSDLICNAPSDKKFDAQKILRENPEIRKHRSLVLDLAYEEFCRNMELGEEVRHQSFARRFPEYEESLMRVLQVHQYLENSEAKKQKPVLDWPKPGDEFGGYRLVELIGRGSFAFVFIAEQLNVAGRRVVLKITRNALDEIASLGRLNHPNIVQIFTVESDIDGFTAICMPLISQVTLFDVMGELHGYGDQPETVSDFINALESCITERAEIVLDRSKLVFRPGERFIDAALKVMVDIARALAYSHQQRLLHCDIKPTNILITPDGRAMLFDFNLSAQSNARTGRIGGTLPYMSPEQLQALVAANYDFEPTMAVDIFSFGVTFYQLLTGKLPFGDLPESESQTESARKLLERQRAAKLSFAGVKGINPGLKRLISDCLAFDPEQRPGSARELVRRLEQEQGMFQRTRRWLILHPWRAAVACLLPVLLIPGGIGTRHYLTQTVPRQQVAELIAQGRQFESEYRFSHAIDSYRKALPISEIDPDLRHRVLCHLAIVYARNYKPAEAADILKLMWSEFPLKEIINSKIELAVIGSGGDFGIGKRSRASEINKFLISKNARSIHDHGNYLSIEVSYFVSRGTVGCDVLRPYIQEILDIDPSHFGANYSMFRIERNTNNLSDFIDETHLKRCLQVRKDDPRLIAFLFKNQAYRLNKGIVSVFDFLDLIQHFADVGGRKAVATQSVVRISDVQTRETVLRRIEGMQFNAKDEDQFILFGITNPLDDIAFPEY